MLALLRAAAPASVWSDLRQPRLCVLPYAPCLSAGYYKK